MTFAYHPPPPALAPAIRTIWTASGTREEFATPEPIVPDGCVELIFNLGDPFVDAGTGLEQPRDLLAGQMTGPVVALPTGRVDLLGVRFRPGRAGAALRTAMWRLQDQLIAASGVAAGVDRLADDLRTVPHAARLSHLSSALAHQLHLVDPSRVAHVDAALVAIARTGGRVAIDALARRLGISRRHLERQFEEHVGLGAKHVARIARVHAALKLLADEDLSGADIAAACGYSDQAHLIRDCKALTGRTPARLGTTTSLAALMRSKTPQL
jgi:AraC-like DNA-binding protein